MSDPLAFDDIADSLYSVDPSQFVAARKDAAALAKDSGDRALSKSIAALRKPTVVGWLVNHLVREEPDDIADLFDLGDGLREAQRKSDTTELRSLSAARQKAIRSLTSRAAELARAQGKTVSEDALREVGQTLGAALADPEIAERVRSGRVIIAESYSGFGPAILSLVPEPDGAQDISASEGISDEEPPANDPARNEARRALATARDALTEAREDEASARDSAESADSDLDTAQSTLAKAKERLTRLRAELHAAEEEEADARKTETAAAREARRLHRVLIDAEDRTTELQRAFDELAH
ncbi:hypothetical protein QMK17_20455 [Rhodococcus sp. G-MC3]|uniref:hypothetical protein n=1 Tax=Rhodococcus sp. G-MC3 TaxID=3046209 RepID=UPI0024BBD973|nr:hypothetical protein [Rhodococcus sp. G-MC3]MDJ0395697.1 hypothetical protein [Rhodococcus sp. G-MC3]